jgi:hypothetical protein
VLPDFTKAKARANRDLLRWVRQQVPAVTPLIQGVATVRQHEGQSSRFVRADRSEDAIEYRAESFEFSLDREEMKHFSLPAIQRKLTDLATRIGEAQTKRMLEVAGAAADSVGNVVHTGGTLTPDHLLEVFRKVEMDFDPDTGMPTPGFVWVMHPDMAATVVPKAKEWEKDPAFQREHERILTTKREEWRVREARRKLVD